MGAAMAVIVAEMWMERFEDDIASDELHSINAEQEKSATDDKTMCPVCAKKVTWKGYSILHRKSSEISLNAIKNMLGGDQWICPQCQEEETGQAKREKAKIFGRYVDDILRSVQTDSIGSILDRVNTLHHNLENTIERLRDNGIPCLDMLVKCQDACVSTSWYQKPTDTGLILSFRALAPIGYKRNMIQSCIHRIFNAASLI